MSSEQPFALLERYIQQALERQAIVDDYQEEKDSYLAFRAGDQCYLLNIQYVLEITINLSGITPLPFSPRWILGLVGSRGDVYSVVDFRWFNQPQDTRVSRHCSYIILRDEGQGYILKVDEILGSGAYDIQEGEHAECKWLDGQYQHQSGQIWQRINLSALVTDTAFINSTQN